MTTVSAMTRRAAKAVLELERRRCRVATVAIDGFGCRPVITVMSPPSGVLGRLVVEQVGDHQERRIEGSLLGCLVRWMKE